LSAAGGQGRQAFEKEWNQKFAWFLKSAECEKITTIHGQKDSMTVPAPAFPAISSFNITLLCICLLRDTF